SLLTSRHGHLNMVKSQSGHLLLGRKLTMPHARTPIGSETMAAKLAARSRSSGGRCVGCSGSYRDRRAPAAEAGHDRHSSGVSAVELAECSLDSDFDRGAAPCANAHAD